MIKKRNCIKIFFCILYLSFIVLVFGGCSKNKQANKQLVDITSSSKQIINFSEDIHEVGEIVIDENAIQLKDGFADDSLIPIDTTNEVFRNNDINNKSNSNGEQNNVLITQDYTNDILYYINFGEDFFIYRIKNGISKLVVDIPAANLYLQNGLLYFMVRSYDLYNFFDLKEGNILSYNPISGNVKMVIDQQADGMIVYPHGIDWYKCETNEQDAKNIIANNVKYKYSFQTGISIPWNTSSNYLVRSDQYSLDSITTIDETTGISYNKSLWRNEDGENHILISDNVYTDKIALSKDCLYGFLNNGFSGQFGIFNMITYETEFMDLIKFEEEARRILYRNPSYSNSWQYSYSLLDNTIFFATPDLIYYIKDESIHSYGFFHIDNKEYMAYDLFTDGENLIGLLGPSNTTDKNKKLYYLQFTVDNEVPEWIMHKIIPTQLPNKDGVAY